MHDLNYVAFALIEVCALVLLAGVFWYTTPFRKRGTPSGRLFLMMEMCVVGGLLSDLTLCLAMLKMIYGYPIPLSTRGLAIATNILTAGDEFFDAFLLLYALSLKAKDNRLLKWIKVPVLLFPVILLFLQNVPGFPSSTRAMTLHLLNVTAMCQNVYRIIVLILIFTVDVKLMICYILTYVLWFLLSKMQSMLEFTAIMEVQILVYTHIIIMNRELETGLGLKTVSGRK